jgi:hypothetical protein
MGGLAWRGVAKQGDRELRREMGGEVKGDGWLSREMGG